MLPRKELETARGMRRSALHAVHEGNGAVFGQKYGWERVNYFIRPDEELAASKVA
jgi:4-methylaminobutanoate oxidase (formaldehyde-forming)